MPRVQDALPGLDCRAWKGRSNPLLLSTLRFAPESRAAIPFWFRITPNVARKGANVAQKARFGPRASNGVVGAALFPQAGMFYVRIGTRKKFRQLAYILKKQNIFLTSLVLRPILKACSNVAETSASEGDQMLIDRRKVVVANGNSRPTRASGFWDIWDTV
jgi:hypothetical protein